MAAGRACRSAGRSGPRKFDFLPRLPPFHPRPQRRRPHRSSTAVDGPRAITVYLVQQALERYEALGLDATLEYYNSPESVQGEGHVFIFDQSDKLIAHADQDLIGMDLKEELGVDSTGYRFGDVMLGATEQGLWVDYIFLNPATGNQEYKHAWAVRRDGLLFGSGWYQVLPTLPAEADNEDKTLTILYWQAPSTPTPTFRAGIRTGTLGPSPLNPWPSTIPTALSSRPLPPKYPCWKMAESPRTLPPSPGILRTTSSGPTAATSPPMTWSSPSATAPTKPRGAPPTAHSPT